MTIYVIVDVTYDYYRFQENIEATADLDKAREIAFKRSNEKSYHLVVETLDESYENDGREACHVLIEPFPQ